MKDNTNSRSLNNCVDSSIALAKNSLSSVDSQAFMEFLAFQYIKITQDSDSCTFDEAVWRLLWEFFDDRQSSERFNLTKIFQNSNAA